MSAPVPRVRIVHETNPRKYFPAVYRLAERGRIDLVGTYRYSVAKEWLRAWIVDRTPAGVRTRHALRDLGLRLRTALVRDEVVILAFAPWSFRMLWYWPLVRRNRIVYQTSWHDWRDRAVPRVYGPLTPLLRRLWLRFLRSPALRAVAVSEVARREVELRTGVATALVPHAVPAVFFDAAREPDTERRPLRLVYVGELSPKKGIPQLLDLVASWEGPPIELTVIGAGPLTEAVRSAAEASASVAFRGPIADRGELARELAGHDVLVLPSRRTSGWEELFGLVIVEAIAAGLGVVASDHVGPRTIFHDVDLGNLFAEDDLDGMSAFLTTLAADPEIRADFRRAHRGIADAYRVETVAAQWAEVIGVRGLEHP